MTYTVLDIVIIFVAMIAAFVIGSKLLKSTEISMALAGVVAVIFSTAHGWTTEPVKVIVEGLNMVTKHVKPRKQGDPAGIMKAESAVYACKVMAVCPKCGKATRLAHKIEGDTKTRVCKHCGASY